MRLLVVGSPVMEIGGVDVAGRIRGYRIEGAFLSVESRDVTGGAIGPLAGFGGSKADNQLPATVPERRHEISLEMRRPEFGLQLRADVRIGMRGEIGCRQIEREFARRVSRGRFARRLAERRNPEQKEYCKAPRHLSSA